MNNESETGKNAVERASEAHRGVVEAIQAIDLEAPPALHRSIDALVERKGGRRRAQSRRLALPATAIAVIGVAIAFFVVGGLSEPSVDEALALGSAGSSLPAPPIDQARPGALKRSVGGVVFPDWQRGLGWRAVGSRADTLDGRQVATVYYVGAKGTQVRFSIVDGEPLGVPRADPVFREGVAFWVLRRGGDAAILWNRGGRTCLLTGRGASSAMLLRLASYEASETSDGSAS
jgi:hypothetical protein